MIFSCKRFGSGETVLDTLIVIFDKSTKLLILAREGAWFVFPELQLVKEYGLKIWIKLNVISNNHYTLFNTPNLITYKPMK